MRPDPLALLRAGVNLARRTPTLLRVRAGGLPAVGPRLRRALSLAALAERSGPGIEAARATQFGDWHPEDPRPRLDHYGPDGLLVLGREFFQSHGPEEGEAALREAFRSLPSGERLLAYAPHVFAFGGNTDTWTPRWEDLHAWAREAGLRVLDFNPGFDRNGFFHFVAERPAAPPEPPPAFTGVGRYFYLGVGTSEALGNSAAVLSATGLRALRRVAPEAAEYGFGTRIPEDVKVRPGDVAMGHQGNWVTGARQAGATTVLYGPGDRFRPTRDDLPFYAEIQTRGTFAAQYEAAHLVIMQAGGRWRLTDPFPAGGLCRWMDLPVSPAVFPRTKRRIRPPGRRVFGFIGLYDDHQKGLDIARALCRRCPEFRFVAIGCKPLGEPNCREFKAVDNRRARFRRLIARADFLVSPARDDAQPGTVAECGSLGLLPIITETTGYVLSFPRRMDADDLDQCEAVLREAQAASMEQVEAWQTLNARYVEQFHRPSIVDARMLFYLAEVLR